MRMDYVFFVYGFVFLLLAAMVWGKGRTLHERLPWRWLAWFGLLHGANGWLEMLAIDLGDSRVFEGVRLAVMAVSFLPLVEFGRCGLRALGVLLPGRWLVLPLLVAAGLGGMAGMNGMNAACRYALGFPGGLLAGWALWRESGRSESGPRYPLRIAGLAFLIYAPVTGVIVPQAAYFPASVVNCEAFLAATGFPIQILRTLCAALAVLGIWLVGQRDTRMAPEAGAFRRWSHSIMVVILLAGGGWASLKAEQTADAKERGRLLQQAALVARTINIEWVQALSFMADDKSNPSFQRLRSQMMAYAQALHLRCIYSMAIRNGRIVFGPESLAENDPIASPPGTVYEKPPSGLATVFEAHRMLAVGPYTDEYGSFVSAFAPVPDPRTGEVVLVVGMDIEAHAWQATVARSRLFPILFTLALLIFVLTGSAVLELRYGLSENGQRRLRYAEVWLTAAAGLALTLGAAYVAHDDEDFSRQTRFAQLAQTQAESVIGAIHDIRDYQLEGLGRFFDAGKEVLTRKEFEDYTVALVRSGVAQAWEWVPAVPAKARRNFEEAARRDGLYGYMINEKDAQGRRMPAEERDFYYPVYYVAPFTDNERTLGYDLGSEPIRRAALEEAMLTGMTTATDPVILVPGTGTPEGTLILRPVFVGGEPKTIFKGFAVVELRFEVLLAHALAQSGPDEAVVTLDLFQVNAGQPPQLLTSSSPDEAHGHFAEKEFLLAHAPGLFLVAPAFVFGKAYAVVVHPGPAFLAANLSWAGVATAMTGLLLTAVLSLFVGFLTKRRADLELQVRERTAELQQSEEKYRAFFDTSLDCVFITSMDGRLIDLNDALVDLFGYENREGLFQINAVDIYANPEERAEYVALIVEKGGTREYPIRMRKKDGTLISTLVTSIARRDGIGRVIGFQGTIRDVTARERAEKALRESERRYRDLFEGSRDGIVFAEMSGRIVDANSAYCRMLGYSLEELKGKDDFYQLTPERWWVWEQEEILQNNLLREGYSGVFEKEYIRKNGEVFPVEMQAYLVRSEDGTPQFLWSVVRDITERKRAANELSETNKRLNDMIEFLPDATLMIDDQGKVIAWNKAIEEMTGVLKQAMLGKGEHEYAIPFYGKRRPIVIDLVLMPEEELDHKEYHQVVRRGDFLWADTFAPQIYQGRGAHLSITAAKLYDSTGKIIGAIETIRNVNERKRALEELVDINRQLEMAIARANEMAVVAELANMAKSEFLANMSHEIRTPLNGAIGMVDLLLDTTLTEEQHQFATLVRTSGEALLSVINDILDFSKIEAHKLELEILDFDMRVTLEDAAEMLTVKAQEKGLELVCLIAPRVPSLVRGDPGRLRQVLVNLAGNAVKFTQRGCVTIRADLEREDEHSALIRFSVSDTGIGIPADRLDAIFSPFTQADGSTTRKYGGTGLGLTISSQLIKLMGGRIGVESEEGKGSTFWFTGLFEKQPKDAQQPSVALADLHGARILVVDDHTTNRLLVTTLLQTWGCRFNEAADGESALFMLRAAARDGDPYRAALVDLQMPEMDGEELGRRIKADPECVETVLVIMTSLGQRGDAKRLGALGFAAYLSKPIRQSQLHDCLAMVLGREQEGEASGPAALITRHTVSEASKRLTRILLAEDDRANQQVALAIIRKLGYQADVVANGKEALLALRAIPYNLVLMDCHMPEMDGYEATRCIRDPLQGVVNRNVPVVAMTARAMKGDREQCLEAGMNDYVSKPIKPQALAEVLEKWLLRESDDYRAESSSLSPNAVPTTTEGPEAQAIPAFDKNALYYRLMGDEELVGVIIEGFLEDMPLQIKELRDLVEDGKAVRAGEQAHKIKGAAATVGGEALRKVAFAMERAGLAGDMGQLQSLMPEVEMEFSRLKTAIRE